MDYEVDGFRPRGSRDFWNQQLNKKHAVDHSKWRKLVRILYSTKNRRQVDVIGSGNYGGGWAVALPLFGPCGPRLTLAHPLLSPILNITYHVNAVLHSQYNVLTSTGIENGIVCCGSIHTTHVNGFTGRVHGPSTPVYKIFFAHLQTSSSHFQNYGWPLVLSH